MKRRGAGAGESGGTRVLRSRRITLKKESSVSKRGGAASEIKGGLKSKASLSTNGASQGSEEDLRPSELSPSELINASISINGSDSRNGKNSNSSKSSRGNAALVQRLVSATGFRSCLEEDNVEDDHFFDSSPKGMRPILLRRALSIRELDDESWLSSSLIDLVISKFSRSYPNTHFMSIDFVVLHLSSKINLNWN